MPLLQALIGLTFLLVLLDGRATVARRVASAWAAS